MQTFRNYEILYKRFSIQFVGESILGLRFLQQKMKMTKHQEFYFS